MDKKKNSINLQLIDTYPGLRALLYIGSICGFIAVFIFRRNLSAELSLLHSFGIFSEQLITEPGSVIEWFEIFNYNLLIGFILSNFFDVINSILISTMLFSLFFVLRKTSRVLITSAIVISLISTVLYISSNITISMAGLSNQYFSTSSLEEQQNLLTAGQTLLIINNPGIGIKNLASHTGLFCLFISGILASLSMGKSDIFSKKVVVIGLIAHITGLFTFIILPINPSYIFIPLSFSAPFIVIWYFIIARKLYIIFRNLKKL